VATRLSVPLKWRLDNLSKFAIIEIL